MSFSDALPLEAGSSPTRSRSGRNQKSPTKRHIGDFTLSSPSKIFKHSQIKIEESSVFSEDPLLMSLSKQLQGTIESFDNKMMQILNKQENKFLIAYKGVIRDVALDLKHYQGQLEKASEEYQESENHYLKQQMVSFRDQIQQVLEINKAIDADNKKLRQMVINLKEELKSEKEIIQKIEEEKKTVQNMCDSLRETLAKKEAGEKALPPTLRVVSENYNPQTTDRSSTQITSPILIGYDSSALKAGVRGLAIETSSKDKLGSRLLVSDRNQGSNELVLPSSMTKRSRSPLEQTEPATHLKSREFKYLADAVSEILRKRITEEEDVKMLTEKIVYSASMFLRQRVKEVKVLKETVDRLQKTVEQKDRIVDRSFESLGDYQKSEHRMLREIFRECVNESTKTMLNDQNILISSVEFLDPERKNEIHHRAKLFERYLSDPRVITFLESVISERPIDPSTSKEFSNSNHLMDTSTVEDSSRQIRLSEGFGSGRKMPDIVVGDSRSISDASTHWQLKVSHQFPRGRELSIKASNNNESISELLSDKQSLRKQSITPISTLQASTSTQNREQARPPGPQFAKSSRSNSNGMVHSNLARGRAKMAQKGDLSISYYDRKVSPNVSFNEDNSLRILSKSPLSRRILVKNGRLVLNPV